ncbi:hypothetical protein DS524_29565, partial [Salmonella enterica subsp. enterica serovar Chester]|nr:hypothetical protein [Salmonella enterica subsp. enterica serovar Chester]
TFIAESIQFWYTLSGKQDGIDLFRTGPGGNTCAESLPKGAGDQYNGQCAGSVSILKPPI